MDFFIFGVEESTGRGEYFDRDQRTWTGRGVEQKFDISSIEFVRFGVEVNFGSNIEELQNQNIKYCKKKEQ